jgi:hypothetical protein
MPVALPVGPLAGEEGIVRRWLDVAVDIERPRRDLVFARGWRPPVERPEPPGVGMRPFPVEPRRPPGPVVNLDLHRCDRRAPRGALDSVTRVATRDFGWRRLEAVVDRHTDQNLTPILSGMLSKRPNYAKTIAKRRSCSSRRLYYIRVATVAYFLKTTFRLAGRPVVKHFCFAHVFKCCLLALTVRFL